MNSQTLLLTLKLMLLATGVLLCAVTRSAYADPLPDRRVEIRLTITVPQGANIPENFPVKLSGAEKEFGAGINAQGLATIVGTFPANTTEVWVSAGPLGLPPTDQASLRPIWRAAQRDANKRFSLPPPQRVALITGQEIYNLSISFPLGVTVSGSLKTAGNVAISAAEIERQGMIPLRYYSAKDGTFEVYGVPKGQASNIFIALPGKREVYAYTLSSAQTAQDHDMGTLTLVAGQYTATLNVQIDGLSAMPGNMELKKEAVCFVRSSDYRIFQFWLDTGGKIRDAGEGDTAFPKISAGDYFVVPGYVATSTDVEKLLRLLRAGRRADVENASLTLVNVAANSTVQTSINVATESSKLAAISE